MFYTHDAFDRADHLRKDPDALDKLRHKASTRLVLIWQGTALVSSETGKEHPQLATLSASHVIEDEDPIFLGFNNDIAYFAIDTAHLGEPEREAIAQAATTIKGTPLAAEFVDLRIVGPTLPAKDSALLAYARGLVYWQGNTNFCHRCGHPLVSQMGGHMRHCTNESCGYNSFPRTDPAVIMLVTRMSEDGHEACLLGRNANWPTGVFSTLAGFVEPGESLEQAVQREVFEEAAIETEDVRYIASQPWPFPRSIMLGFQAVATNSTIKIDPHELADARWFTREELKTFGNWGDERYEFQLPRPDSIARLLIDQWLNSPATTA